MGFFGNAEAESVDVLGKTLRCEVCHHTRFWRQTASLHGAVSAFFDVEWLTGRKATCIVCERCGYIHWFMPVPEG